LNLGRSRCGYALPPRVAQRLWIHARGAIFSIADTAVGLAHVATLDFDKTATTVESKINFLRPALTGELRAHARCVKQGRTLSFFECDICDGEGRLVARSNATMMTLNDNRSDGRDRLHSAEAGKESY
jgi:acyl-CoA thioesterase